jgi:osmotically-inducible protein OsmY
VQLSGFAATSDQKGRAADLAKAVSGIRSVENRISVGR